MDGRGGRASPRPSSSPTRAAAPAAARRSAPKRGSRWRWRGRARARAAPPRSRGRHRRRRRYTPRVQRRGTRPQRSESSSSWAPNAVASRQGHLRPAAVWAPPVLSLPSECTRSAQPSPRSRRSEARGSDAAAPPRARSPSSRWWPSSSRSRRSLRDAWPRPRGAGRSRTGEVAMTRCPGSLESRRRTRATRRSDRSERVDHRTDARDLGPITGWLKAPVRCDKGAYRAPKRLRTPALGRTSAMRTDAGPAAVDQQRHRSRFTNRQSDASLEHRSDRLLEARRSASSPCPRRPSARRRRRMREHAPHVADPAPRDLPPSR